MKTILIAQAVMLAVFVGSIKYIHDRFAEMSCESRIIDVSPKVKIIPKYRPSEHSSEAQHKFEHQVKRTE